jgi:hypothetical protein
MSANLILLTGVIYCYVAFDQYRLDNVGMTIAYIGYAFSNIGLFMLAAK